MELFARAELVFGASEDDGRGGVFLLTPVVRVGSAGVDGGVAEEGVAVDGGVTGVTGGVTGAVGVAGAEAERFDDAPLPPLPGFCC